MCCLFGIHDYGHRLSRKQRSSILSALAIASEARGTDATGIAYNAAGKLCVYKRPLPGHLMWFRVPQEATVISGHTRAATQGSEKWNWNNHPFLGKAGTTPFALAHNGVLYNDLNLRKDKKLPATKVETDSYIAVQLIEAAGELSFASLRNMAEPLRGSFTFTVLSPKDELYFVKGDNPMCIYHYPNLGVYLYASTEEILKAALRKLPFRLGRPDRIDIFCGQILCIDAEGHISRSSFDDRNLYNRLYAPWYSWEPQNTEDSYIEDLKSVAAFFGYTPDDVDFLLQQGYTTDDIEELLYCG